MTGETSLSFKHKKVTIYFNIAWNKLFVFFYKQNFAELDNFLNIQ